MSEALRTLSEVVEDLEATLANSFVSPNESDSNGEIANVVDGLYVLARAIHHLAQAVEGTATDQEHVDYHHRKGVS